MRTGPQARPGRVIFGVDPGLQHTGWGAIAVEGARLRFLGCGTITPVKDAALAWRLHALSQALSAAIREHQPTEAAIEKTFVSRNASSTLKLGNARGALLLTLAQHGLEVSEYDATRVKKSLVGVGQATKDQMAMMVRTLLPACDSDASADALDSLAVAITHAHRGRGYGLDTSP